MGGWCGSSGVRPNGGFDGDDPSVHTVNLFNEIAAVPKNAETDIINFTVAPAIRFVLHRIEFTGSNIAKYKLYIGGVAQAANQTWFNGDMSSQWDFTAQGNSGLKIPAGTNVRVTVLHSRPDVGTFSAQVHGINIQEA
jgi:hypothetical protein